MTGGFVKKVRAAVIGSYAAVAALVLSASACSLLFGLDGYAGRADAGQSVDAGQGVDADGGGCGVPDPVAYWKLDEGEGGVAGDSTGNGNVGTLVGGPVWVAGIDGGGSALLFDGTTLQYVDFGNPEDLHLTGSMTISAWFRGAGFPLDGGPDMPILSKRGYDRGWSVYVSEDNVVFDVATSTSTYKSLYAGPNLVVAEWYHVVGVYDSAAARLDVYVDGTIQGSLYADAGAPIAQYDSQNHVHLGNSAGCSATDAGSNDCSENQRFHGAITEVRVYAAALNGCQVQAIP